MIDIGAGRKRTANVIRSEVVRERIEDHLMRCGGKISRERYEAAREDFLTTALRVAERDRMRSWSGPDKHAVRASAKGSLLVLFGERTNTYSGTNGGGAKRRTGVNVGWVLDVWERALNYINRADPFQVAAERRGELLRGSGEPTGGFPEPPDGPRVFEIVEPAKPVSTRLLDAYLNRDDEAIMRIAVELENLEVVAA